MATGKTRTAAAFIKRLFDANLVTRVLFLVDRIPLALQTEDAFAEHLRDYPCYTLRSGRRFEDQKRITITTLQSMINLYHEYSSGYFDLIIIDECHRSIYGKWSGVLKHFDGITVGLTATPCVANIEASGDAEDGAFVRDTLKFFEVDKPTFSYKMHQAIAEGYLVPYQIYKAKTVKTAAEGGFPVKKSEIDWSALDAETKQLLDEVFANRHVIATVDLPNHLAALIQLLPQSTYDVVQLAYSHTLFPIYAPFNSEEKRQICLKQMAGSSQGALHSRLGMAASPPLAG